MDGYQKTSRIKDTHKQITEGQITGLLGTRIAIAKAIALTECERLPNGAPNINKQPNEVTEAIRDDARRILKDIDSGTFKIKSHYAASGVAKDLKGWLRAALALSKASKAAGAGNCQEQAAYVYCRLYKLGYFPIELVKLTDVPRFSNHGMIVIGLPLKTKKLTGIPRIDKEFLDDYIESPDAVICDPWMKMLLFKDKGIQTDGAYTIKEYINLVGDYVAHWGIDRIGRLVHS
jgi:hypothetical protein